MQYCAPKLLRVKALTVLVWRATLKKVDVVTVKKATIRMALNAYVSDVYWCSILLLSHCLIVP